MNFVDPTAENEKEAQELFEPEIQTQNGFGKQLSNRTFVGQVSLHDGFFLYTRVGLKTNCGSLPTFVWFVCAGKLTVQTFLCTSDYLEFIYFFHTFPCSIQPL